MSADLSTTLQRLLGATYRLESELLGGGMSRVFVAEEPALRRKVVVKVLPPDLVSATSLQRFQHEIEVTARLQHPHILPIVTAGSAEGILWYVAPFIEERSLRDRLARDGRLPRDVALRYLAEVAEATAFAHARGVVHRDIKPGNVLLHEGHAILADFGVSRALKGDDPAGGITGIETHAALAAYLPPDRPGGEGADAWALGALAHELLTGEVPSLPVTGKRVLELLGAAGRTERAIADLLVDALALDPAARIQRASDFHARVESIRARAGATGAARRWRAAAIAIATVTIVLTSIGMARARIRTELAGERPIAVQLSDAELRTAVTAALQEWRGVSIAADGETRRVQSLSISGVDEPAGVSLQLAGSNGRPIALIERVPRRAEGSTRADTLRALARDIASFALRGAPSPLSGSAAPNALSLAAWRSFDSAAVHLQRAELDEAKAALRRTLSVDPAHRSAQTRLAMLLLATADTLGRAEAELLLRTVGNAAPGTVPVGDSLRAAGWRHLLDQSYPAACEAFEGLLAREPSSWDAWLGLGECLWMDDEVLPDPRSPTGYRFRTSSQRAATAYERAELLANGRAPVTVYAGLRRTLPTMMNRIRLGRAADVGTFVYSYATLEADTLAHHPAPRARISSAATRRAVEYSRQRLQAIAERRLAAQPKSRAANLFLAEILEQQGIIDRPRAAGPSALSLVRERRRAPGPGQLEDSWVEVRLLLRRGLLATAVQQAAAALQRVQPTSSADETLVALLATITGDSLRLRASLERVVALDSRRLQDFSGQLIDLPEPVMAARARYLPPALLDHCTDDVERAWERLQRAVDTHVADTATRANALETLRREVVELTAYCARLEFVARDSLSVVQRVAVAGARKDEAAVRRHVGQLWTDVRELLPGEAGWAVTHAAVQALLAVGDTTEAYNVASRHLAGIANSPIEVMDRLEEIGGLRRMLQTARGIAPQVAAVDRAEWWLADAPTFAPVAWER